MADDETRTFTWKELQTRCAHAYVRGREFGKKEAVIQQASVPSAEPYKGLAFRASTGRHTLLNVEAFNPDKHNETIFHRQPAATASVAGLSRVESKAAAVHALVNAGHFPGMSEAFDAEMGVACWTDPAYAADASMWAAAWKAATRATPPAPLAPTVQPLTEAQIDALIRDQWATDYNQPLYPAARSFAKALLKAAGITAAPTNTPTTKGN